MSKSGNKLPNSRIEELRTKFKGMHKGMPDEKEWKKQWTQESMADRFGVTVKTYRKWEQGALPDTRHLVQLAQLFHVSTDYLLDLSDYTNDGNKEISEATGLTNDSIEFLRYLNYRGNHYANDDIDRINRQTISFLNRVLEEEGRKATYDADGDTKPIATVFLSMERYILSKKAVASIGGQSGKLITFENDGMPLTNAINPLYQETLMQTIRKHLDYFKEKAETEEENG